MQRQVVQLISCSRAMTDLAGISRLVLSEAMMRVLAGLLTVQGPTQIKHQPEQTTPFCFSLNTFMLHFGSSIKVSAFIDSNILIITHIPLVIMQTGLETPKYTTQLTPQQMGFLEYYMLPEKDQFDYIYRPGDDSFLMLSVLKNELPTIPPNSTICEIGTGSGILSAHLNKWLLDDNNPPSLHVGTDISLDACLFSCKYYQHYGLNIEQCCTSLLKGLRCQPEIIICNPPYVPTDPSQKQSQSKYLKQKLEAVRERKDFSRSFDKNLIAFSYMGGPEGLDTTRQLIRSIRFATRLYTIVMGEEGLITLKQELEAGELSSPNMQASCQVMQFMKKMNEQLYVVLIEIRNK